ncbi:hypothetical protein [Sphingomonas sp. 1P08PE]|uniref:hypothetical protein n=1 Tax=Sphingomonas sp. 1P08PE TaxID=554122 RepID=UPI00399FDE12
MSNQDMHVTRRSALIGAAAGASVVAASGVTAAVKAVASPFGEWATDDVGLPTYRFTAAVPVATKTPAGKPYPLEADPFFLIGNDGLSLFTYASGHFLLMSGERGWVRLNSPAGDTESNGATLTVTRGGARKTYKLLGDDGLCATAAATREFGCGSARYRMTPETKVTVERTLSVAPSSATDHGAPAFVVTIRITNADTTPIEIDYVETVLSHPTLTLNRAPVGGTVPVRFVNTATALPGGIVCDPKATSDDPLVMTAPDAPNRYNLYPPSLALLASPRSQVPLQFEQREVADGGIELAARARVSLAPGASKDIVFITALKPHGETLDAAKRFADALPASRTGAYFRTDWARALATFAKVPDPKLRAELAWDGHALLAMATYSGYHGKTFIPQGMTYDYHMDLTAAPRDHLQHSMAAAYYAPHLAKSTLLYTLCKMTYQGEIKYTDFGNGETSNSAWNTSDQQLYLFQAMGEYLRITRDWSILADKTAYLPKEAKFGGTTLEKLERAFIYLRDEVSTGAHGLIRLMNSDWSDMVYVDTSVLKYFHTAESQMNTGMAMAVIPNLIEQLTAYSKTAGAPVEVARLIKAMQLYVDRIAAAMTRDMEGRVFAKRIYLDANTAMGDDTMHLEPQSFLLQAPGFPLERKRALWKAMQDKLIAGEVLGPRQREKPVVGGGMEPGTSENGGFWYALSGQTVIGVATFDRTAALALLDRMTFRNFARHYPSYWVGQWTAPDTINAEFCGDLAGLPRPDNDGLWSKFAGYCAHAHAWPIYGYYRIRDLA